MGTVDSYQGKENRIVIVSIVRNDTSRTVGFLVDPERINVGLSRAKDRLVIVSSSSMWSARPGTPLSRVLAEIMLMGASSEALVVPSLRFKREEVNA